MRLEGLSLAAQGDVAVGLSLEKLREHRLYVGVVVLPPEAVLLGKHVVAGPGVVANRRPGRLRREPRCRLLGGLVGRRDRAIASCLHHRGMVVVPMVAVVVEVVRRAYRSWPARRGGRRRGRCRGCRVGRAASGATSSTAAAAAAAGPRHCQRR